MRRSDWSAALLAVPLLAFLLLGFVAPIGTFLWRGITDNAVAPALPRTLAALRDWDAGALPATAFPALAADLRAAPEPARRAAAARLNIDTAGLRAALEAAARDLAAHPDQDPGVTILAADPAWSRVESWGAIRRAAGPLTDFHLLAALDLKRDAGGAVARLPADQRVFRTVFVRSFAIAAGVTLACLLLGYPLAALLALLRPGKLRLLLLGAVLLPFWTGLLVRTTAWMVLLSHDGPVNRLLVALGLVDAPAQILFTRTAVVIAMVHILLPYMVLPLRAVMLRLSPSQARAAASLGAGPVAAFRHVWLPQTAPGIAAGCVLVFIQALGFYITPALLGGGADQMLPWFIGFYATQTLDWGLAAALSLLLLAALGALAILFVRSPALAAVRQA